MGQYGSFRGRASVSNVPLSSPPASPEREVPQELFRSRSGPACHRTRCGSGPIDRFCRDCYREVEPDPVRWRGATAPGTAVADWCGRSQPSSRARACPRSSALVIAGRRWRQTHGDERAGRCVPPPLAVADQAIRSGVVMHPVAVDQIESRRHADRPATARADVPRHQAAMRQVPAVLQRAPGQPFGGRQFKARQIFNRWGVSRGCLTNRAIPAAVDHTSVVLMPSGAVPPLRAIGLTGQPVHRFGDPGLHDIGSGIGRRLFHCRVSAGYSAAAARPVVRVPGDL